MRVRPLWHKVVGGLAVLVGLALYFAGLFDVWGIDGAVELAVDAVALAVGSSSVWWWGAFDAEG
ncbi:MAG: hypothetical protein ACRDZV_00180 [Acidimicrobiia bacterium]